MEYLVDTSAFYALLARNDASHAAAARAFPALLADHELTTHNYVVVELTALVAARLPPAAVRELHTDLLPAVRTVWIDEPLHRGAVSALVAAPGAGISLVDRVSFEIRRRRGIDSAFAFDRHFVDQGFTTVP